MKKFLLMAAIAMMTTVSYAQDGYDDTKHEIAVSAGVLSNSQWIDVFEEVTSIMFGGKFDNEKFIGPFSAEYFYHVKNWLGVGAVFVYGQNKQDMLENTTKVGEVSHNYLTLMPAAKFDWVRNKNIGLYSKLAVGATLRNESAEYTNGSTKNDSDTEVHVNWQASLIGFEAGSPYVRGFIELGMGEQGVALVGLRYKF